MNNDGWGLWERNAPLSSYIRQKIEATPAGLFYSELQILSDEELLKFEIETNRSIRCTDPTMPIFQEHLTAAYAYTHGPQACQHEWKKYVGFTQVYDYCAKCDEKKKEIA